MLEPDKRQLFLNSLKPPDGYELDTLIGTSFSLDLAALLGIPMTLTLFGEDYQGDPTAIMMALRRYAERMTIYCQQGAIQVPKHHPLLYSYLESVVIEVNALQEKKVFHPKIWVLRYKREGKPAHYRLLCMSRNLTYDRCWDTILLLEGHKQESRLSENEQLAQFLKFLTTQKGSKDDAKQLAEEMTFVRFEAPAPFEYLRFHALGLEGQSDSFERVFPQTFKRLMVISPFIDAYMLNRLAKDGKNHVLISRADELDCLSAEQLSSYPSIFTLDEAAHPEAQDEDIEYSLRGLHSKFYLGEFSDSVHVWTGSANASNAAFNGNIEFLVELISHNPNVTIESLIQPNKQNNLNFRTLLAEYQPNEEATQKDALEQELEDKLEMARTAIIGAGFAAMYEPKSENEYWLCLDGIIHEPTVTMSFRPVTIENDDGFALDTAVKCSLAAITPFFVFTLTASSGVKTKSLSFVLKLPISGIDLSERDTAITNTIVGNKHNVMRYLLLLLGDLDANPLNMINEIDRLASGNFSGSSNGLGNEVPLFETMVRALARQPERLREIERFVSQVDKELLPDKFSAIWEPIKAYVQR